MSKATKRKHVTREVLDEFVTPEERQIIVKIIGSRGNNLHEAETSSGNNFLISMPSKFRKNVWIKRGDYVIVDPIDEGNKVRAEIAHILYPQQVKYLKKQGLWPKEFMEKAFETNGHTEEVLNSQMKDREIRGKSDRNSSSDSDTDDELFFNSNRIHTLAICSDSESSDDEEISDANSSDHEGSDVDHSNNEDVTIKPIINNNTN